MVIFSQHEAFKEAEGAESSPGTGCQRFYSKKIQTHSAGPGQAGQKAGKDMARMEQDKGRGYMITLVWDGHLGLFEEAEEAELLWPEDEERVASAVDASGRPAHSVDVLLCAQRGASKQVFGLSVRRNITVWPVATRSGVLVPWGHLGGHTARSSPPRGCPALELPHQYTAGSPSQRYRTGRMWWYVWSASASPETQQKKKHV